MTTEEELLGLIRFGKGSFSDTERDMLKSIIGELFESATFTELAAIYLHHPLTGRPITLLSDPGDGSSSTPRKNIIRVDFADERLKVLNLAGDFSAISLHMALAHEFLHEFGIVDAAHYGLDFEDGSFDLMGRTTRITNDIVKELAVDFSSLADGGRGAYQAFSDGEAKAIAAIIDASFAQLDAIVGINGIPGLSSAIRSLMDNRSYDISVAFRDVTFTDANRVYFFNSDLMGSDKPRNSREFVVCSDHLNELRVGAGNDTVVCLDQKDIVFGGDGADILFGNGDHDLIYGEADNDILFGGSGRDDVYGGDGLDFLSGDGGVDLLNGQDGSDYLFGGADNDRLFGGASMDVLFGGDGRDTMSGGTSSDYLDGGKGNDTLRGGSDSGDAFRFNTGAEFAGDRDIILDWALGDGIYVGTAFAGATVKLSVAGNILFVTTAGGSLEFDGVGLASRGLIESSFVYQDAPF